MSRRADSPSASAALSHLGVMALVATLIGVLVAGIALPFAGVMGFGARSVANSIDDLPEDLTTEPLAQRTRVLAADGSLLATWYDQNRTNVSLDKVALVMRKAIVAIEDYRFYQHGALDMKGTLRAFITNQASDNVVQGGSSITQQMVKQTLINQADSKEEIAAAQDDTYARKFRELRYAIAFEQNYSKDWILERYLNVSYFGDGAYGIEAASRHYFSKPAAELKLREAAMLAGIVKNPTRYDPTNDPTEARERRNTVLGRMAQLNVISRSEARRAVNAPLGLDVSTTRNGCVGVTGEFFCDYLYQYLLADPALGRSVTQRKALLRGGGLTIQTTLSPRFQRAADASVRSHVFPTDQAIGGLALVVPGTGEVRALSQSRPMGGNKAKGETYLNYVVPPEYGDANGFQAGSTFKAFTLAAAINQGIPLSTRISSPPTVSLPNSSFRSCDGPVQSTEVWPVANSTSSGTYDLYQGTQLSVNTFFAELERRTGLCAPTKLAESMGVQLPEGTDSVPSFTLGVTNTDPLTMAGAYATFAARGEYCEPRPVSKILAASGKVLVDYPDRCRQVMPASTADAVNDVLRGVQEPGGFGYDNGLGLSQVSAGKTGTINGNRAVWFVGYTPNMAAAAMMAGANSLGQWVTLNGQVVGGQYIDRAFGSTYAGPIWGDAMQAIDDVLPDADFTEPDPTEVAGQQSVIPSVGGYSPTTAAERLRAAGFSPVTGSSVYSGYPYGTVAYTSPGGGTTYSSGSSVTMYLSAGPAPEPKNNGGGRGNGGGGGGGDNRGGGRGGDNGGGGGGGNGGGGGRGRG